jgi:3',5'-cyclic AMP phosphodiesterase CpdA
VKLDSPSERVRRSLRRRTRPAGGKQALTSGVGTRDEQGHIRPVTPKGKVFTLAHFSDPHLSAAMPWPQLHQLHPKRALGYLSWRLRRRPVHGGPVLEALIEDLQAIGPDHVVITGDITNISLPKEFTIAGEWLHALGEPHRISVIPGNHDAYVHVSWEKSLAKWAPFMTGVLGSRSLPADLAGAAEEPVTHMDDFPFMRVRGHVAIIGISTAAPTRVGSATGRVGKRQLDALDGQLQALEGLGLFRVVLIHHPPLPQGYGQRRELVDAEDFHKVIARRGAELILHGHMHRSLIGHLPTPNGKVPVIGVPSASARAHGSKDHARYHLYRIDRVDGRWDVEIEVRGVLPSLDRFVLEHRYAQPVPA